MLFIFEHKYFCKGLVQTVIHIVFLSVRCTVRQENKINVVPNCKRNKV